VDYSNAEGYGSLPDNRYEELPKRSSRVSLLSAGNGEDLVSAIQRLVGENNELRSENEDMEWKLENLTKINKTLTEKMARQERVIADGNERFMTAENQMTEYGRIAVEFDRLRIENENLKILLASNTAFDRPSQLIGYDEELREEESRQLHGISLNSQGVNHLDQNLIQSLEDQLSMLRLEISDVRLELETKVLEYGDSPNFSGDEKLARPLVVLGSGQFDENEKWDEETRNFINRQSDQLNLLRLEMTNIRQELENKTVECETYFRELEKSRAFITPNQGRNGEIPRPIFAKNNEDQLRIEISELRDEIERHVVKNVSHAIQSTKLDNLYAQKPSPQFTSGETEMLLSENNVAVEMNQLRVEISELREEIERHVLNYDSLVGIKSKRINNLSANKSDPEHLIGREKEIHSLDTNLANEMNLLRVEISELREEIECNLLKSDNLGVVQDKKLSMPNAYGSPQHITSGENEMIISYKKLSDQNNLLRVEISELRDEIERHVTKIIPHANQQANLNEYKLPQQFTSGVIAKPIPDKNIADEMNQLRVEIFEHRDEIERHVLNNGSFPAMIQSKKVDNLSASKSPEYFTSGVKEIPNSDNSQTEQQMNLLRVEIFEMREELERNLLRYDLHAGTQVTKVNTLNSYKSPQHISSGANEMPISDKSLFNQNNLLRVEIWELREELEDNLLKYGSNELPQNRNLSNWNTYKVPDQMAGMGTENKIVADQIDVLRVEISELREEIENKVLESGHQFVQHKDSDNFKVSAVSRTIPLTRERNEVGITDKNLLEQLKLLRVEISDIRNELESKTMEGDSNVTRKEAKLYGVAKLLERDAGETSVNKNSHNQLTLLRLEMAEIRSELEKSIMECDIKDKQLEIYRASLASRPLNETISDQLDKIKPVSQSLVNASPQFENNRDDKISDDQLSKIQLSRLRVEITDIRLELENNVIECIGCKMKVDKLDKIHSDVAVAQQFENNNTETAIDNNELAALQQDDQLRRLRGEIADIRNELESKVLEANSDAIIPKDLKNSNKNELADLQRDDQLRRLRGEISDIRNELESKILEANSDTIVLKNLETSNVYRVPRHLENECKTNYEDENLILIKKLQDQLNRLKIEIADVRYQLENSIVECSPLEVTKEQIDIVTAHHQSALTQSEKPRKLNEIDLSPDDELKRIRIEMADVRRELESSVLQKDCNSQVVSLKQFEAFEAAPDIPRNRALEDQLNRLRIEITDIRHELENKVVDSEPFGVKNKNENLIVRQEYEPIKAIKQGTQEVDGFFESKLQNQLNLLRIEIADIRHQLETNVLESDHDIIKKENIENVRAFPIQTSKQEIPEKINAAPDGKLENQLGLLRVEISDVRHQLENNLLLYGSLSIKESNLESTKAYPIATQQQNRMDTDLQLIDLESYKKAQDQITLLRIEMSNVRLELENSILQSNPEINNFKPVERLNSDTDSYLIKKLEDQLYRLRIEITNIREELEAKVLQYPVQLFEENQIESLKVCQVSAQSDKVPNEKSDEIYGKFDKRLQDQLNLLRIEIADIRRELETKVLESEPHVENKIKNVDVNQMSQQPQRVINEKSQEVDLFFVEKLQGQVNLLRIEIADVRQQLETSFLESDSNMVYQNNLASLKAVPIHQQKQEITDKKYSVPDKTLEDQLRSLRIEIADIRQELETSVLKLQPNDIKDKQLVHCMTCSDVVLDKNFENQLNKLRIEIADVRQELENRALDSNLCENKVTAVATPQISERFKNTEREPSDQIDSIFVIKLQDQLKALRLEISIVRDELEQKSLECSTYVVPNRDVMPAQIDLKNDSKVNEELNKLRVEITNIRLELENSILANDSREVKMAEIKAVEANFVSTQPTNQSNQNVDDSCFLFNKSCEDQLNKFRTEIADTRFELENAVLMNDREDESDKVKSLIISNRKLTEQVAKQEQNIADSNEKLTHYSKLAVEYDVLRNETAQLKIIIHDQNVKDTGVSAADTKLSNSDNEFDNETRVNTEKSKIYLSPNAVADSQLKRLRSEIADVRRELENEIVESDFHVVRGKELQMLLNKQVVKIEPNIKSEQLTKKLPVHETPLDSHSSQLSTNMETLEDRLRVQVILLRGENGRLSNELQQLRALTIDKDRQIADTVNACESTTTAIKSEKDRELNKLAAENEYLNRELKKLRLNLVRPLIPNLDSVDSKNADILQSGRPTDKLTTGLEIESVEIDTTLLLPYDNDEVEKAWQEVERRRIAGEVGRSRSPSESSDFVRPDWDREEDVLELSGRNQDSANDLQQLKLSLEMSLATNAKLKEQKAELEIEVRALRQTISEQSVYLAQMNDSNVSTPPIYLRKSSLEEADTRYSAETVKKLENQLHRVRVEITDVRRELEKQVIESASLKNIVQDNEKMLQKHANSAKDVPEPERYRNLGAERDSLLKELEIMREQVKHNNIDLEKLKISSSQLNDVAIELQRSNGMLKQSVEAKDKQLEGLRSQLSKCEKLLAAQEARCKELERMQQDATQPETTIKDEQQFLIHSQPNRPSTEVDRNRSITVYDRKIMELKEQNENLRKENEDLLARIHRKDMLIDNMVIPIGVSWNVFEKEQEIATLKHDFDRSRKIHEDKISQYVDEVQTLTRREAKLLQDGESLQKERELIEVELRELKHHNNFRGNAELLSIECEALRKKVFL